MSKEEQLEELARMVKQGFDDVQERFATKDDFKVLVDEIRLLRDDTKYIKSSLAPLAGMMASHDRDIEKIKEEMDIQ